MLHPLLKDELRGSWMLAALLSARELINSGQGSASEGAYVGA